MVSQSVSLGEDEIKVTYFFIPTKGKVMMIIATQPAKGADLERYETTAKSLIFKK